MKRVGLAVGLAFLALLASEWFANSAFAETPKPPPLTAIQEDDAVPEIAKYKNLYGRVTASDWQPAVTVKASLENGESKRYPKADFFCKQIKSTADIQFAARPKPGTFNFAYARVTSIDCASQPGAARMTGVFVWNNGEVWAGEVSAVDRELHRTAGFFQALDKSIQVFRASIYGPELVAVAGPQGATLLATGGNKLYGYEQVPNSQYGALTPLAKVSARLIVPGVGYFEGRSSAEIVFRVGPYKQQSYPNEGYGAFYAPDDSFRIIGPIWNESLSWKPDPALYAEGYPKPQWDEAQKPETLVVDLRTWCSLHCHDVTSTMWAPANNYFYMATCAKGIPSECAPIRIETRVPTVLGPPGKYTYEGVVDLTKAPDLSKMLSPKFGVNYGAEPITYAQHFQKIDEPAYSLEQIRQLQADWDQHFQTKLEQVEALGAVDDKMRIDNLARWAQENAEQYAQSQAELQAERQAEARREAEMAAAIMGAFADLSRSAIASAEDLNETRALVDRTNAASAGGFVARNTPYVAPQLTEEQRQLLASKWGRSGGKSVTTAGSGQVYAGRSVSGSSSASEADEPESITQAEAEAIMTSSFFVTEDGTEFATNGAFVVLYGLASDRFWSQFMRPVDDMVVDWFKTGWNGTSYGFNLQGTGTCKRYLDMQSTSEGHEKLIDPETGHSALAVEPCTWNFTSEGDPSGHYIFSAGVLKGWVPK
jgi:hypothetical protein